MKVLIPVDGSRSSENAVRVVCEHWQDWGEGEPILLINVTRALATEVTEELSNDGLPFSDLSQEMLKRYYQHACDSAFVNAEKLLNEAGIPYRKLYEAGPIAAKIQAHAERENVNLIVMGTRGQTQFESLLFGSVMTDLIANTTIPTLVVANVYEPHRHEIPKIVVAMDTMQSLTKPLEYVLGQQNAFGARARYELIHVEGVNEQTLLTKTAVQHVSIPNAQWRDRFDALGLDIDCVKLAGETGMAIVEYCQQSQADMLVMGSHGYDRLRSAMMGSIVRRVASLTKIPLLIVR